MKCSFVQCKPHTPSLISELMLTFHVKDLLAFYWKRRGGGGILSCWLYW